MLYLLHAKPSLMHYVRKLAVYVLDLWFNTSLSPLDKWRADYAALQAQLIEIDKHIRMTEAVLIDFNSNAVTGDVYAEYYNNKQIRSRIYEQMRFLDQDKDQRAWYHATRRMIMQ